MAGTRARAVLVLLDEATLFAQHVFDTTAEVQTAATRWLWTYNHERPNWALGGTCPPRSWLLLPNSTHSAHYKWWGLPGRLSLIQLASQTGVDTSFRRKCRD